MILKAQRPQPRLTHRHCRRLHDPANDDTVGEHVVIVVVPLAGGAGKDIRLKLRSATSHRPFEAEFPEAEGLLSLAWRARGTIKISSRRPAVNQRRIPVAWPWRQPSLNSFCRVGAAARAFRGQRQRAQSFVRIAEARERNGDLDRHQSPLDLSGPRQHEIVGCGKRRIRVPFSRQAVTFFMFIGDRWCARAGHSPAKWASQPAIGVCSGSLCS